MVKPVRCEVNPYGGRGRRGRIGLLGGSFNPAHAGHHHIALQALHRLGLDGVWLLVSPQNPLKSSTDMAPLAQRLASAQAIAGQDRRLLATAVETRLDTRYTVETLKKLQKRYPQLEFVWIMGADNLIQLPQWHHWQDLLTIMPMAVMARAPFTHTALHCCAAQRLRRWRIPATAAHRLLGEKEPHWVFLPIPLHSASSTAIRHKNKDIS